MRRDDFVDFFQVADRHLEVHARLEAWASWVRVRPHGWQVAPMFRQFRSNWRQWHEPVVRPSLNIPEAIEVERVVAQLPEKHREAVRWAYYWATVPPIVAKANGWANDPLSMARRLGVSKNGLKELVEQGRTMVANRVA